jgi:hypothetical protein
MNDFNEHETDSHREITVRTYYSLVRMLNHQANTGANG